MDLPQPEEVGEDELSQQIALLLALHPEIQLRFRSGDLKQMDAATKQLLLDNIRGRLDIRPFLKQSL